MAAYRHWRILVTEVDGSDSYASFGEIELLPAIGAADLTTGLGGAATQSGNGAVGAASAGVDDNQGTETGSSFPLPYWWAIDLGATQEVTVLTLRAQRIVPNRSPRAFDVQGSPDGSAWTTVASFSGAAGWTQYEQREFIFGQQYQVQGEIRISGVLMTDPRRVRVYDRATGAMVGEADSASGLFSVPTGANQGEYYIVPIDLDADATDWSPPCANRVVSTLVE